MSPALGVLEFVAVRQIVARAQTETWVALANDEKRKQTHSTEVSVHPQQANAIARPTLG